MEYPFCLLRIEYILICCGKLVSLGDILFHCPLVNLVTKNFPAFASIFNLASLQFINLYLRLDSIRQFSDDRRYQHTCLTPAISHVMSHYTPHLLAREHKTLQPHCTAACHVRSKTYMLTIMVPAAFICWLRFV